MCKYRDTLTCFSLVRANLRSVREAERYLIHSIEIVFNSKLIQFNSTLSIVSSYPIAMGRTLLSLSSDLLVFIGFLVITTVYPLWNDITGRKGKHTKASYIFATGRVSMVPMMFSIARGVLSVRALLGKAPFLHSRLIKSLLIS